MPSSFSITDTGRKRKNNQDYVFTSDIAMGPLPNLYIVADGMGGHNAGEYASRYTVDTVAANIVQSQETNASRALDLALKEANRGLQEEGAANPAMYGMGTTFVAASVSGSRLLAANVGDSRAYLFRSGQLTQLTEDHTYVNSLVKAGILTPEEAAHDERKNVITKAMGAERNVEPDFFQVDILEGDIILMCTDGLYDEVTDEEIAEVLDDGLTMSAVCAELVLRANLNGGHDNITAVSLRVMEEDIHG